MVFPFEWPVEQDDSWPAFEDDWPDIDINSILNDINNGCNCNDIITKEETPASLAPIINNNQISSHDDNDEQRTTTSCSRVRVLPPLMTEKVYDNDTATTTCTNPPQTLVQQEEDTSIRVRVDEMNFDDFDEFNDQDWEKFLSFDDIDDHFVDETTTLTAVAEAEADHHISHSHNQEPPPSQSSSSIVISNNNNDETLMKNDNNNMMMTWQDQALVMQQQQQAEYNNSSNNNSVNVYKRKSPSNSYWTEEEHMCFLKGLLQGYRSDWQTMAKRYVPTKSVPQITSHAQKYFKHHQNFSGTGSNTNKRRKTIHDVCLPGFDHFTIINTSLLSFRPHN